MIAAAFARVHPEEHPVGGAQPGAVVERVPIDTDLAQPEQQPHSRSRRSHECIRSVWNRSIGGLFHALSASPSLIPTVTQESYAQVGQYCANDGLTPAKCDAKGGCAWKSTPAKDPRRPHE